MIEYVYNALYSKEDQFKIILWTGVAVAAFLNIFQPFGINNGGFCLRGILMVSGYGLATSLGLLVLVLSGSLVKKIYNFHPWLFFIGSIILISSLAYTYFNITFAGNGADESFIQILLNTMIVGMVILFLIRGIFTIQSSQNEKIESRIVKIPSRNKSSSGIKLPVSSIVLLEASGNYVSVTYLHDNALKKKLIRNTMKTIESLVIHQKNLVRCHTSFMVNIEYVIDKKRENKRHYLNLRFIAKPVPVSGSYIPALKNMIG